MTIQTATVAHLADLRLLFTRLVGEGQAAQPGAYPVIDDAECDEFTLVLLRQLEGNPAYRAFVAEHEGRVIGFVTVEVLTRAIGRPHRVGFGHWMYVRPEWRGKGIGHALMAAGLDWLGTQEVDTVELYATPGDAQWSARGFAPTAVILKASTADVGAYLARPPTAALRDASSPDEVENRATPPARRGKRRRARKALTNGPARTVDP